MMVRKTFSFDDETVEWFVSFCRANYMSASKALEWFMQEVKQDRLGKDKEEALLRYAVFEKYSLYSISHTGQDDEEGLEES
jgi:hypothetical protein